MTLKSLNRLCRRALMCLARTQRVRFHINDDNDSVPPVVGYLIRQIRMDDPNAGILCLIADDWRAGHAYYVNCLRLPGPKDAGALTDQYKDGGDARVLFTTPNMATTELSKWQSTRFGFVICLDLNDGDTGQKGLFAPFVELFCNAKVVGITIGDKAGMQSELLRLVPTFDTDPKAILTTHAGHRTRKDTSPAIALKIVRVLAQRGCTTYEQCCDCDEDRLLPRLNPESFFGKEKWIEIQTILTAGDKLIQDADRRLDRFEHWRHTSATGFNDE